MVDFSPEDRRILFASHACYLDDSNGAAVASRALMECLARRGWMSEVACGGVLELGGEPRLEDWLNARGLRFDDHPSSLTIDGAGVREGGPPVLQVERRGVRVAIHRGRASLPHAPDSAETSEFLRLFNERLKALRPRVFVGYGGDALAAEMFRAARRAGATTVFALHNFQYSVAAPFADVDVVVVPSHFAAGYYHGTLGLRCTVLPNLVDMGRVVADSHEPRYLTFVNPSPEKGVWAFARIADELGRLRPDIPILVVESRGTEETVAACGLDLRVHGNVYFMSHTHDPRKFWRRTRVCLMPSLWSENQPLVAIESMTNGIPVIGSDRGGIPEVLGASGAVLPLPDRLTPRSTELPTDEEVAPWVAEIIRLWDDREAYAEARRLALAESSRWEPSVLEERYDRFFRRMGRKAVSRGLSTSGAP